MDNNKIKALIAESLKKIQKENQELGEMARISTNLTIGDKSKAASAKTLYAGTWIAAMIEKVEAAGEKGVAQPVLAKELGKSGMQALNPKVREFLELGIFTKGELSQPKKEPKPTGGKKGRPAGKYVEPAKADAPKSDDDAAEVDFEEETEYNYDDDETKLMEDELKKPINEAFAKMQKLAFGKVLLKENQDNNNILSFLTQNKQELLNKLTKKFDWDEDDIEMMSEYEIGPGADADGNEDAEIAGLGEAGLDFSFNPKKVKDTYGDASNFKLNIAGKTIYGIAYNF